MNRIIAVEPRPSYRLWLRFMGGAEGEVDLSHLVGKGVFASWRDVTEFDRVFVDTTTGTVCWPNDIDLDPEVLFSRLTGAPLPGTTPANATP